ncbi:MAG: pyridoxal-phosphate dependent enzyme [Actinomycetota bacterium]
MRAYLRGRALRCGASEFAVRARGASALGAMWDPQGEAAFVTDAGSSERTGSSASEPRDDSRRTSSRAIFRRLPDLARGLAWIPLGEFPTPVQFLERLGKPYEERSGTNLFVKRDDLSHPGYGGNKVRKFEFVLGKALTERASCLATAGGWGSHHALATAFFARQLGLSSRLYLFPQPVTEHVRRQLLAMFGCGASLFARSRPSLAYLSLAATSLGRAGRPFAIPPGGSTPEGILGYVDAGLELAEQVERGEAPRPDAVVVALGSGGTAAGLALGLALGGIDAEVLAVGITTPLVANLPYVEWLHRRALNLLRAHLSASEMTALTHPRLRVVQGFLGRGYGYPSAAGAAAAKRALTTEGLPLEPTYTAKAMAALLSFASESAAGKTYLFWDTFSSRPIDPLIDGASIRDLPADLRIAVQRARRQSGREPNPAPGGPRPPG